MQLDNQPSSQVQMKENQGLVAFAQSLGCRWGGCIYFPVNPEGVDDHEANVIEHI